MKTILDQGTLDELIGRIKGLNEKSVPEWGSMTIYQMMKHCTLWEEMVLGKKKFKRVFLGRLFGKKVLKGMIKDEKLMKRNLPTAPGFKIKGQGDVGAEKAKWIALLQEHAHSKNTEFEHSFFGRMTMEQCGYLAYKHFDHHLRQFHA